MKPQLIKYSLKAHLLVFFIFCFLYKVNAQTATISGVINNYVPVSTIAIQSITVPSATGFVIGDKVLLIQMKGATIDLTNTPSFGTINSYNEAGNYEMLVISSISLNTITFTTPILRTYNAVGLVQLVKVPVYNNVNVTGALTCLPWNGTTGGILVFEASGNISLSANIDVTGKGFLGGAQVGGQFLSCSGNTTDFKLPNTSLISGNKGEGIALINSSYAKGLGALANGGGAGNDVNGGGAGGGNFGMGGHGGNTKCSGSPIALCGGYEGKNCAYSNSTNKIFLGGGGGSGHENDGVSTAGVSGGGIVIIRSGGTISGNGNFINANGNDNNVIAGNDGQGGGGAGGTVLLDVCSTSLLNISVKGGKGGTDNFSGPDCHGKGGGGGGGVIWTTTALSYTSFLTGGNPGVFTNSASQCFNTSNGATIGQIGGALSGLIIPGAVPLSSANGFTINVSSVCIGTNNGAAIVTLSTSAISPTLSFTLINSGGIIVNQTNNTSALTNSVSNLPNGIYTYSVQMSTSCGLASNTQTININCSPPSLCSGTTGAPVFFEDFGSGSLYGPALPPGVTNYIYQTGVPGNGTYVIANSSNPSGTNAGYVNDGDHTGNPNGYMMVVNSDYPATEVYRKHVTGLCQNTTYVFSAYLANNNSPEAVTNVCGSSYVYANIKFQTEFPIGTVLNSIVSGNLAVSSSSLALPWIQYGFAFTTGPGQTSVDVVLKNNAPGGCGNDYVVDDISLAPCGPGVALSIVPSQTLFCIGDGVNLQSSYTSGNYINPQYQWQFSNDGGVTWSNISGATSSNYNISSISAAQGGMYHLLVSENGNINMPSCSIIAGPLTFSVNTGCNNSNALFSSPDTVCVNQSFTISNLSTGANSSYWSFCQGNTSIAPQASNMGNVGFFNGPVFSTIAKDGSDFYAFITNNSSSALTKLFFGSSLLNVPVATNLGNVSGAFPSSLEDIHLELEGGNWYGITVGGSGGGEAIVRLNFGNSLANTPTAVSMGNIGGMSYPQRLKIFKSGSNYYGFTTNRNNNTITRFSFGTSIANTPTGLNMGNIGSLSTPDAIAIVNVTGLWYGYIINEGNNTITRLDFGNSLLNTPTGTNLGNTGGLNGPRGIDMWTECNEVRGLITNRFSNDLLNMSLPAGPTGAVVTNSYGNIAGFSFPHSITRFRSGDTLFAFITNVSNNTISRIYYPGCVNSSIASSTLSSPPSVSYNTPGTYYINLLIDEGQITQTNYCKQVTVIGTPTIVVTNTTICAGFSASITASGATTYSWNAATNLSSSTGSLVIATPSTTESYTVTGAISSCTNSAITTVSVIPNPTVAITGNTLICIGQSSTLTANGSGNYLWNTSSISPSITVAPNNTQTYSVLVTSGSCTNSASATVSVVPIPTIVLSPNASICQGSNTSATLTANGASSYTWANASTLSSPTGSIVIASPNITTNYTVTGINAACSNTAIVTVSVNPSPTITSTLVSNTFCGLSNGSATVTSLPSNNTYTWSSGIASLINTASSLASGNYTVTAINGACTTSSVITILSSIPLTITGSTITPTHCNVNDGSIKVTDNFSGSSYSWTPLASSTNNAINLAIGNYSLTIINGACTTSTVISITQLGGPTAINVIKNNVICLSNGNIKITNVVNGVAPYQYSFNNSAYSTTTSYTSLTQGIYTVTVKDANTCLYTQTLSIVQTTINSAIAITTNTPNCESNDGVFIIDSIFGGKPPYQTSFNNTAYTSNTTFEQLSTGIYTLSILDSNYCETGFLLTMPENNKDYTLYIPNTFTPNKDKVNDIWYVQGSCLGEFNCLIFNRWGQKISELKDITDGWDGTYNGVQVPDGVYVYIIEVSTKQGTVNKTGHITVFR